jgi:hemoglobin-like flavoprotein
MSAITPQQKRLVRETFDEISESPIEVALLFYGRLFELDPSLRPLFRTDLREQSQKLVLMLSVVVKGLDRFEDLLPELAALGRRHVDYGVKAKDYATLSSALLWALARSLEPHFDLETKAAWASVIGSINEAMVG